MEAQIVREWSLLVSVKSVCFKSRINVYRRLTADETRKTRIQYVIKIYFQLVKVDMEIRPMSSCFCDSCSEYKC